MKQNEDLKQCYSAMILDFGNIERKYNFTEPTKTYIIGNITWLVFE